MFYHFRENFNSMDRPICKRYCSSNVFEQAKSTTIPY